MRVACLLGNERKGRYVELRCHDSLMFKRVNNQELDANIEKNCFRFAITAALIEAI